MATAREMGRGALWILPVVLVVGAFFAALPWLKTISQPVAILVTATVVIFAMSYMNYISFRAMRRLDEVQKAGAAFAAQWGAPAGQVAFGLLLVLPPFIDVTTAVAHNFAVHSGMPGDRTVVVVSLALGLVVLVFLESIGRVVVHAIWWKVRQ
jgi:hypothetical protein